MKRLWQKKDALHPMVTSFTVGDDQQCDNYLLPFDCVASIAHAEMLSKIGILTKKETSTLRRALQKFIREHEAGDFHVSADYEDCHTAIESRLVDECGEIGKRIHSGRSRNDQVFCALLLYGRHQLFAITQSIFSVSAAFLKRAQQEERTPMMGRTHLQNAMPSTVGVWAAAYAEQIIMLSVSFEALYQLTNRSPLGSAAGYGVPLPLDRHYVARLLGFEEPHHVVLTAVNSRGHWEACYLDTLGQIMMVVSRVASDLMLFTLPEIGYMHLPPALCTGSSIMPHKKNPDVLELMRAKAAVVIGLSAQVKQVMHALSSGYNRDLQETKRLLLHGVNTTREILSMTQLVVESLEIDRERLTQSIDPQIYSVDRALRIVQEEGVSFRDAYHRIAEQLADIPAHRSFSREPSDYGALLDARNSWGAPGNLQLPLLDSRMNEWRSAWLSRQKDMQSIIQRLTDA